MFPHTVKHHRRISQFSTPKRKLLLKRYFVYYHQPTMSTNSSPQLPSSPTDHILHNPNRKVPIVPTAPVAAPTAPPQASPSYTTDPFGRGPGSPSNYVTPSNPPIELPA